MVKGGKSRLATLNKAEANIPLSSNPPPPKNKNKTKHKNKTASDFNNYSSTKFNKLNYMTLVITAATTLGNLERDKMNL